MKLEKINVDQIIENRHIQTASHRKTRSLTINKSKFQYSGSDLNPFVVSKNIQFSKTLLKTGERMKNAKNSNLI
jgi:hypothetical protein